jgi:K+-sensing histidine kinase KdpD
MSDFAVMLIIGIIISTLTARIKQQLSAARQLQGRRQADPASRHG